MGEVGAGGTLALKGGWGPVPGLPAPACWPRKCSGLGRWWARPGKSEDGYAMVSQTGGIISVAMTINS